MADVAGEPGVSFDPGCSAEAMSLNELASMRRSRSSVGSSRVSSRPPAIAFAAWAASRDGLDGATGGEQAEDHAEAGGDEPGEEQRQPTLPSVSLTSLRLMNSK